MENALSVVCDMNLFLHMQSFVHGNEGIIAEFLRDYPEKLSLPMIMEEALAKENWKVVNKILTNYKKLPTECILSPWKISWVPTYPHHAYASLTTCKWLHENMGKQFQYWQVYMDIAAGCGNLELVQYMHTHRPEGCTYRAMDYAAMNGHMHVIQFLHENRHEGCSHHAMNWAAMKGHLDVVLYLYYRVNSKWSQETITIAMMNGQDKIFQFFQKVSNNNCQNRGSMVTVS